MNNSLLSTDSSGVRLQAFSPNPDETKQVTLSTINQEVNVQFNFPQDLAINIYTTQDISYSLNDDGIFFDILAMNYYGIVLNDKITSITFKNKSSISHIVNIMVM